MSVISTRLITQLAAFSLLLSAGASASLGQPGTVDTSFGTNGSVVTQVGAGSGDYAVGVVNQPDGKIVVGGTCYSSADTYDVCLVRYSSSGALDFSFGAQGKVITNIPGVKGAAKALALQTDGKVVLVGSCYNITDIAQHLCAFRYNSNGNLDVGFGSNGWAITPIGSDYSVGVAVAIQPDGKIVVAGICFGTTQDFCALRYNSNGTLDVTFGDAGKTVTAVGLTQDLVTSMALQSDGKIVVIGSCQYLLKSRFCALRYQSNGALDTAFGSGGKVDPAVTPDSNTGLRAIAIATDGKLIVVGTCGSSSGPVLCANRYLTSGTLDSSFGTSGVVTVSNVTDANSVALQPDGKLVVAGQCGSISDFCALRFQPSGVLDASFGINGKAVASVRSIQGGATALALQTDGKIVLVGSCVSSPLFCATRLEAVPFSFQPCSLDVDGDGLFLATTDALIYARVALGMTGSSVITGINFRATATRNSWPLIRDYLVNQCGLLTGP